MNSTPIRSLDTYGDIVTDQQWNDWLAGFVRGQIRAIVRDPETERNRLPGYPIDSKRQVTDQGYDATFNCGNLRRGDLREDPMAEIIADGVRVHSDHLPLDLLALATVARPQPDRRYS